MLRGRIAAENILHIVLLPMHSASSGRCHYIVYDGIFAPGLSATIYIIHLSLHKKIIWLQIWMQADIMRQMTAMTTA